MATSAGRILLIPKGNYDAATTYQPLDIVFYNNASYVCKATTLGNAPTNTTYWQIFSEGFDVEQFYANIAPTYNAATTYAAGDHFIYNDVIYTVNVACTGITPPNANYYSVATITGLIEDNTAAISTLNSNCAFKTQISNPNLLDNPWFTVNQRGKASYTGDSVEYTVDRWKRSSSVSGGHTLTVGNVNLPLSKANFYQVWPDTDLVLKNEPYTISVIIDGDIYSKTFTPYGDSGSEHTWTDGIGIDGLIWNIRENWNAGNNHLIGINNGAATQDHVITAIKLERGSFSTLAQDSEPNYQQELAKCQRYFQRINLIGFGSIPGILADATTARIPLKLEPEMRTGPSVTISDVNNFIATRGFYTDATALSALALQAGSNTSQVVVLYATLTTAKNAFDPIFLGRASNEDAAYIDLSADL